MITVPAPPAQPDQPCNGREGVDIPAVDIPAVHSRPVVVPERKLGGRTVPGFTIPGVAIAAHRVGAQCATIDPAPAGCLGRVTIPAGEIPGVSIPAARIPGVDVDGAKAAPVTAAAVRLPPARKDAVIQEQVCAQKVRPGDYQPSVYRERTYRERIYRPQAYRKQAYRPQVCVKDDCIPPVNVPPVNVPPVTVAPVNFVPSTLEGRRLPELRARCVSVFSDAETAAYQVCADVLFAFNRADLRASGKTALREIARSLKQRYAGRKIQVDGHTDAKGSPAYNQALSERRAAAVARFLSEQGGISSDRISERGYGETKPVAPNTRPDGSDDPKGRRKNRRVVVGVVRK